MNELSNQEQYEELLDKVRHTGLLCAEGVNLFRELRDFSQKHDELKKSFESYTNYVWRNVINDFRHNYEFAKRGLKSKIPFTKERKKLQKLEEQSKYISQLAGICISTPFNSLSLESRISSQSNA